MMGEDQFSPEDVPAGKKRMLAGPAAEPAMVATSSTPSGILIERLPLMTVRPAVSMVTDSTDMRVMARVLVSVSAEAVVTRKLRNFAASDPPGLFNVNDTTAMLRIARTARSSTSVKPFSVADVGVLTSATFLTVASECHEIK